MKMHLLLQRMLRENTIIVEEPDFFGGNSRENRLLRFQMITYTEKYNFRALRSPEILPVITF